MEAGAELFAARGYDGASVGEIARRADVNKALISYHFGGKQALYETILGETLDDLGARLAAQRNPRRPAGDQLAGFIAAFAQLAATRPELPAMILREVLSGGHHLSENIMPRFLGVFAHVREIVGQGVREGAFRPVNPLLTHLGLIGSLVFFHATTPFRERMIREGKLPAAAPSSEEFVRHLQEMTTRGLDKTQD